MRPLVVWLAAAVVVACSSSGTTGTTVPATAPRSATTASPQLQQTPATSVVTSPSTGSAPAASINPRIPAITDGNWTNAHAHIDVTGDRSVSDDTTVTIAATNAFLIGAFGDATSGQTLQFTMTRAEQSGFAFTSTDVIGGGDLSSCQVSVTHMDAASLTGEFTCAHVDASNTALTQPLHVELHVTFSGTP